MTILCIALGTLALVCAIGWFDAEYRFRSMRDIARGENPEFDFDPEDQA